MERIFKRIGKAVVLPVVLLLVSLWVIPGLSHAQDRPTQRQIRTYVPPDQLVSFLSSTPFSQFIEFLNPIFERVVGKRIIDPDGNTDPIGISIAGMHFLDAFELVLEFNQLSFRETEGFFIIQPAVEPSVIVSAKEAAQQQMTGGKAAEVAASLSTREIQINAILFELNMTKARQLGIDWNVLFGGETGSSRSGSSGGTGGSGNLDNPLRPRFFLRTDELFEPLDDVIIAPSAIEFSTLTQLFRLLETEGVGETVASPSITVQSAEEGRIQIGTDVPIQTRDFSGNTITQLLSTGIIVNVTPTLFTERDTTTNQDIDFIHLDVLVEKSGSRPSLDGPVIDRNTANTQVLLLDGEQTVIGGLYSTEESVTRRGIPLLKDLPGWFFGLRYLFGYEQKTVAQKELLIVLQARVLEPLEARARRPLQDDLLNRRRDEIQNSLQRFNEGVSRRSHVPVEHNR